MTERKQQTTAFLSKVDLSLSSGHTIFFDEIGNQMNYFRKNFLDIGSDLPYLNRSGSYRLDLPIEVLVEKGFNYFIFNNIGYEEKYYFANIIGFDYFSDGVTILNYAIDNLQTYMFEMDLNHNSFVKRRHLTRYENHLVDTLPFEDLTLGDNYYNLMNDYISLNSDNNLFVITCSKRFEGGAMGSIQVPHQHAMETKNDYGVTKTLDNKVKIREGATVYLCDNKAFESLLMHLNGTPAFANVVQNVKVMPFNVKYITENGTYSTKTFKEITGYSGDGTFYIIEKSTFMYNEEISVTFKLEDYLYKSLGLKPNEEKPPIINFLKKRPYTILEVNDNQGNLSQYSINNVVTSLGYVRITLMGSIGITPTIAWTIHKPRLIDDYNKIGIPPFNKGNIPQFLIADKDTQYLYPFIPVTVPVNHMATYLQANQNQLEQNRINRSENYSNSINNMAVQQQLGLKGVELSQQNNDIQRSNDMTNFNIQQNAKNYDQLLGNISSGVGMFGSVMSGNIGAAVGQLGSAAMNNLSYNNNMNAQSTMFGNNMNTSKAMFDNTIGYQNMVMNENYAMNRRNLDLQFKQSIASEMSRLKDIENIPNTFSTVTSASMYNMLMNRFFIGVSINVLERMNVKRIGEWISMYGFKVNLMENISTILSEELKTGTYIETVNADIRGNIPVTALEEIKTRFNNGITVWKDPDLYRKNEVLLNG